MFLLFAPLFASISHASQSIEIRPAPINISGLDTLSFVYAGEKWIDVVGQTAPAGFLHTNTVHSNESWVEGTVDLVLEDATEGSYQYSASFHSIARYTVEITVMRYNISTIYTKELGNPHIAVPQLSMVRESIAEYECPANITVQVNLSIQILGTGSQRTASSQPGAFITIPGVPEWEIGLYAMTLTPFLAIAVLNIRDLRGTRKAIWTTRYSAAVVLRHLFYGLILAFFVVCAVFLALLIGGVLLGVSPSQAWISTGTLFVSALPIIPLGIAYGLAKRSGWYDLLDEA